MKNANTFAKLFLPVAFFVRTILLYAGLILISIITVNAATLNPFYYPKNDTSGRQDQANMREAISENRQESDYIYISICDSCKVRIVNKPLKSILYSGNDMSLLGFFAEYMYAVINNDFEKQRELTYPGIGLDYSTEINKRDARKLSKINVVSVITYGDSIAGVITEYDSIYTVRSIYLHNGYWKNAGILSVERTAHDAELIFCYGGPILFNIIQDAAQNISYYKNMELLSDE